MRAPCGEKAVPGTTTRSISAGGQQTAPDPGSLIPKAPSHSVSGTYSKNSIRSPSTRGTTSLLPCASHLAIAGCVAGSSARAQKRATVRAAANAGSCSTREKICRDRSARASAVSERLHRFISRRSSFFVIKLSFRTQNSRSFLLLLRKQWLSLRYGNTNH